MEKKERRALLSAGLAGCMWGAIGLFVNLLGKYGIGSIELTVSRFVISALVLGNFLFLYDKKLFRIHFRDIPGFLAAGICCLLLFNVGYGIAIEQSSMSVAAVLLYTSPAIVTLLSVVVFHERLTVKRTAAVLLAVTGCAFISGIMTGFLTYPLKAYLWGICAAICYAAYSIVADILLKKYHAFTVLFYAFLLAAVGGCFFTDLHMIAERIILHPGAGLYLVAAAFVCNLCPYFCYNLALKNARPGYVSVAASVEPAAASLLGVFVLRENLDVFGLLGIGCILCAILLQNGERKEKNYEG